MIEILSDTALATVQDLGRKGALAWGVGTAGAMDPLALAAGNLLLGNTAGAAAIEVQIFPFQVRFEADRGFAVTGAACPVRLDDRELPPWWRDTARAGQVLRLGPPTGGGKRGARAYLCLAGGIDVPVVLNSRSTQLRGSFGGHDGRALRRGDRLGAGTPATEDRAGSFGLMPALAALPFDRDGLPAVRVLPAAEYGCFGEAAQAAFWGEPWTITPQSDRYGYRLAGPPLATTAPLELRSHGIVPGVIQVPPGGQPIVQMRDAQPSGGYPKIGTVIDADLWRLGQAPIGSRFRFVEANWEDALRAGEANAAWLATVERRAALGGRRAGGG